MNGESPATRDDRGRVELAITLYPVAAGGAANKQDTQQLRVSGIGTANSHWGTTAYAFSGSLVTRPAAGAFSLQAATLVGKRVSGFDCGDARLALADITAAEVNAGGHRWQARGSYTDDNNRGIELTMELSGSFEPSGLDELSLRGTAWGFDYAEFLAAGESLGGAD